MNGDDVVDVIGVRDLRATRPGDLVVHGDQVLGEVIIGREDEIRVELFVLPTDCARWSWSFDRIACDRGTVPILNRMRQVLAVHGVHVGDRLHIMREVKP